ncbi:MAG: GAF domain-containing protein, partial [Ktedonobacterales bacterium]|nr:GAF domain-containing protein [Ktedonobacterales bacterium]
RYVRKDGTLLWAAVTVTLVRDEDDAKPQYFIAVIEDISARKRLERRAHEALNALLAMAHALMEGPEDTSGESQQDAMRRTARRLAELTCDVLECQRINISIVDPVTDLVQPLTIVGLSPEDERRWWEAQTEPRPLGDTPAPELIAMLRAGEPVIIDMRRPPFADLPNPFGAKTVLVAPMRSNEQLVGLLTLDHGAQAHTFTEDEGKLAGAVAQLAALVIERERLQRERAEAQANAIALREANRRMDEFLGIASHEIKTPLTAIKASMQMAQRRANKSGASGADVAASVADVLERGERQVGRLTRLVDDLLDVARISANKLELRPERCDLAAIVRDAVDEQRSVNPQRAITLTMPDDAQVLIKADPDRIGQVVSN